MGKVSVILTIRHPYYYGDNKYETIVGVLPNDYDESFVEWVSDNIANYLDGENILYDYDNYQDFLDEYYPDDDDDDAPPFRVSYYQIKKSNWKFLMDEFIEKIMNNFNDLDNINFEEDSDSDSDSDSDYDY